MRLAKGTFWGIALLLAVASAQDFAGGAAKTTSYFDDSMTVQSILNECNLKNLTVDQVTKAENGRVVSLDLSNRNIAADGIAKLPGSIGNLTELHTLIAKNNSISELPFEFFRLTNLRKLDLASNQVALVPSSIGNLVNLEWLDLRHNGIETLPPEIGKLKKLKYLQLWGNKMAELEPAVTMIPVLKELYLKDNRLTTLPDGILTMNALDYIDLQGNKICKPSHKIDAWLVKKDKRYHETQVCW